MGGGFSFGWSQVGWTGRADEEVGDGVVGSASFRAQWGGHPANLVELIRIQNEPALSEFHIGPFGSCFT